MRELFIMLALVAMTFTPTLIIMFARSWLEMDEFKKSLERRTRWREFYDEQPEESEWWK